jgi:hypothetical protein
MEAVTGQSIGVIELAEKVIALCDAHTDTGAVANAALRIAETVISSRLVIAVASESSGALAL